MFHILCDPSCDELHCCHHIIIASDSGNLGQVDLVNQVPKPVIASPTFLCILICHPVGSQITAVENKLVVFKIEIGIHFCIIISL